MARFRLTLLAFLLAMALAVMSGTAGPSKLLDEVLDHAPGAKDADGNEMRFVNGGRDDDDDDLDDLVGSLLSRRKHHHKLAKKKNKSFGVTLGPLKGSKKWLSNCQITWYASNDLKNPQCGNGKWNPDNGNHIGAVMAGWKGGPACGEFVQLCNPKHKERCVLTRIVDKCAGCGPDHVDLTKSAFKKLSPSGTLKEGRIHGLTMFHGGKPNPWNLQLFGPFQLK